MAEVLRNLDPNVPSDTSCRHISPTIENWTTAHLIKDFVEPYSKEKRAIIRFTNGEESDVYWGALQFPKLHRIQTKGNLQHEKNVKTNLSGEASTSNANIVQCSSPRLNVKNSSLDSSNNSKVLFGDDDALMTDTLSTSSSEEEDFNEIIDLSCTNKPSNDKVVDFFQSSHDALDLQRPSNSIDDGGPIMQF